jgi:glycosyltransferase involved in cell wall biosynthesis
MNKNNCPKISVITPFSRGLKELTQLLRDFKNQTLPKSLWEHIIVRDGGIPDDVAIFMKKHINDYNIKFTHIDKDPGDMRIAPGTRPRNHGVSIAQGEFCYFFDDDDRAKDTLLEKLLSETHDNAIACVQMSCQESRIYKNGNPDRIIIVPEAGLPTFPIICHVGTPCFVVNISRFPIWIICMSPASIFL